MFQPFLLGAKAFSFSVSVPRNTRQHDFLPNDIRIQCWSFWTLLHIFKLFSQFIGKTFCHIHEHVFCFVRSSTCIRDCYME